MKILQIGKYFYPKKGGIETYEKILLDNLPFKFFLLVVNKKFEIKRYRKHKLIKIPKIFEILDAPLMKPFNSFLNSLDYDLIHLNVPNPFAELFLLLHFFLFKKTKKLLVTYHADPPIYTFFSKLLHWLRLPIIFLILKFADRIIATTKTYARTSPILKHFLKKVEVIPLSVDLPKVKVDIKKLKKKLKVKDEKIVLFVGRLYPYKGLEYLLKAFKYLENEKVKLVIVGDGVLKNKLKKMVEKLNLTSKVVFFGSVGEKEKVSLYKLCDIFVLPSINRGEAFGISILEAFNFGKPVISTFIEGSGVLELNLHNKTGLVVKPKDEKQLYTAIKKLLKNFRLRKKLGSGAKKRAKDFSLKKFVQRMKEIYISLSKSNL